jgi:K+-transporting ATPase KdpF subunit
MKLIISCWLEKIPETIVNFNVSGNAGYLVGIIISLIILAYLLYSLLKPEKF